MSRVHDMGGQAGFGPVPAGRDEQQFPADWEMRVAALSTALMRRGTSTGDEFRDAIERIPPQRHNVIVCTLCSCYPTSLLGPSPSWYKSFAYRSRTVRAPRAVLAEFGLELPAGTEILVWDSSAETRYLVVPARPADSAGLDEDALARLVTRNGMIGTAAV